MFILPRGLLMFKSSPDPAILLEIGVVSGLSGKKLIVPLSGIIIISDIILLSTIRYLTLS
jgi:hypothetical protein